MLKRILCPGCGCELVPLSENECSQEFYCSSCDMEITLRYNGDFESFEDDEKDFEQLSIDDFFDEESENA